MTDQTTQPTVVGAASNMQYVVAVVLMALFGIVATAAVAIMRPPPIDNSSLYTIIGAFIAPTTLSLLSFMKAQETHLSVNSRLDAFMGTARAAAHMQGLDEGRAEGRVLANQRTDELAAAAAQTPAFVTSEQLAAVSDRSVAAITKLHDALQERPAAHRSSGATIREVEAPVTVVLPHHEDKP